MKVTYDPSHKFLAVEKMEKNKQTMPLYIINAEEFQKISENKPSYKIQFSLNNSNVLSSFEIFLKNEKKRVYLVTSASIRYP